MHTIEPTGIQVPRPTSLAYQPEIDQLRSCPRVREPTSGPRCVLPAGPKAKLPAYIRMEASRIEVKHDGEPPVGLGQSGELLPAYGRSSLVQRMPRKSGSILLNNPLQEP